MADKESDITTETELRKVIGSPVSAIYQKKIGILEAHSMRYLQLSQLVAISSQALPRNIHLVATQQSHLQVIGETQFSLLADSFDEVVAPIHNKPCALYVIIAGFEESLRINGFMTVTLQDDGRAFIEISIKELYFHCAKSIRRSQFWSAGDVTDKVGANVEPMALSDLSDNQVRAFIHSAPFLLLATQNQINEADFSPRGDPGGFIKILDDKTVLIPERPGNKIADSLSNMLVNPAIAVILFIPGAEQTVTITGRGKLSRSQALLNTSVVKNKTPKLCIVLTVEDVYYGVNTTLSDVNLWNSDNYLDRSLFPSLGVIVSEQLQATKKIPAADNFLGRVLGKAVGATSEFLIEQDYKRNLY